MFAEYDDPVFKVLAMVSAVLRLIGNTFNLIKNMGGKLMKKSYTIILKLTYVVETLLVVGNLGECFILLLAVKDWVDFPSRPYIYPIYDSFQSVNNSRIGIFVLLP